MKHVFGPVPSRRLGFSLGIDIIPPKTCTLDCVYCQAGRTTQRTTRRQQWIDPEAIIKEVAAVLEQDKHIDYITFSGSGEPTLSTSLGSLIRLIKRMCAVQVAVLTNGTLLHLPEVREQLAAADLVVPSLDAATHPVFEKLNRPHPDITVEGMIAGMQDFRRGFSGRVWLEVMIVKGLNDAPEELEHIAHAARSIAADKIQINTVSRPGAEKGVAAADPHTLLQALHLLGDTAEIIGDFDPGTAAAVTQCDRAEVLQMLKRRPCSLLQIVLALGAAENEVQKQIAALLSEGAIVAVQHRDQIFYCLAPEHARGGEG